VFCLQVFKENLVTAINETYFGKGLVEMEDSEAIAEKGLFHNSRKFCADLLNVHYCNFQRNRNMKMQW
jgi:hypothetical protein